ncbi:hypothetical protein FF1_034867 [Malus domestica]
MWKMRNLKPSHWSRASRASLRWRQHDHPGCDSRPPEQYSYTHICTTPSPFSSLESAGPASIPRTTTCHRTQIVKSGDLLPQLEHTWIRSVT